MAYLQSGTYSHETYLPFQQQIPSGRLGLGALCVSDIINNALSLWHCNFYFGIIFYRLLIYGLRASNIDKGALGSWIYHCSKRLCFLLLRWIYSRENTLGKESTDCGTEKAGKRADMYFVGQHVLVDSPISIGSSVPSIPSFTSTFNSGLEGHRNGGIVQMVSRLPVYQHVYQ